MKTRWTRLAVLLLIAVTVVGLLQGEALVRIVHEARMLYGGVETRRSAARTLQERADEASAPAFERALADEDLEVRCVALWALGAVGTDQNHAAVRARLEAATEFQELRYAVFTAGQLRDRAAAARLSALAQGADAPAPAAPAAPPASEDTPEPPAAEPPADAAFPGAYDDATRLRCEATSALGLVGGPEALKSLTALVADERPRVRLVAAVALGNLGPEQAPAALRVLEQRRGVEKDPQIRPVLEGSISQLGARQRAPARPPARDGGK